MAQIGDVIDGKYKILTQIGAGGMSKVYLAMDSRLNKQWAVKELEKKAHDKNNDVVIQSAIAEAGMMKKLDHPNLPRIVDIIDEENVIYVVMDYIEGEPLDKILEEYGAQPQDLVIEWAKQLCEVLMYLHNRKPPIIYRDMKPGNVMLKPDGNLKLIDFGIAREYKEQNLADTQCLGTRGYAAPEQYGGKGQTDQRTDIFCLGVTIYHLVTGKNPAEPPYEIYPIRKWNPSLSSGLERIVDKCTQLNPEDRYQSCEELLYALNHYNEIDDEYRHIQKNKMKKFATSAIISIACFAMSLGTFIGKNVINGNDYDENISLAEKSSDQDSKENYYEKAIDVYPDKIGGYIGLVNTYKSDNSFDENEEARFKKIINTNLAMVKKADDYGSLAFEIGKLYWYYYDYGNTTDNTTRSKSAAQWFKDAKSSLEKGTDEQKMAEVYEAIGNFNNTVTINIEEADDKGMYKPYFKNLSQLIKMMKNSKEQEKVKLELYNLTISAIENYARKFKNDGISQEKLQSLYDDVVKEVNKIQTTIDDNTDKIYLLKSEILGKISECQVSITNAYRPSMEEE